MQFLSFPTLAEGLQRLPGHPVHGQMGNSRILSSPECVLPSPQVQLDNLPGMSLMAGKALSSARMSDAVLSQSSLMASQQLRDRDGEGEQGRGPGQLLGELSHSHGC